MIKVFFKCLIFNVIIIIKYGQHKALKNNQQFLDNIWIRSETCC